MLTAWFKANQEYENAQGKRFYLWLLLTVVTSAISFDHLHTVNGITYDTYKNVCNALGLLGNDQEWIQCLTEAGVMQTGYALRFLFATILLHCNPGHLWNSFKHQICDDLAVKLQRLYPNQEFTQEEVYMYGLHLIKKIMIPFGKNMSNISGIVNYFIVLVAVY